jgi:hypothetical protein
MRKRIRKPPGVVRDLAPDDPRNPKHAMRREEWLKLADLIGGEMARRDYERLYGEGKRRTKGGDLRPLLK